jgi:glycosyltransferase involved in cell wall biosynthesis
MVHRGPFREIAAILKHVYKNKDGVGYDRFIPAIILTERPHATFYDSIKVLEAYLDKFCGVSVRVDLIREYSETGSIEEALEDNVWFSVPAAGLCPAIAERLEDDTRFKLVSLVSDIASLEVAKPFGKAAFSNAHKCLEYGILFANSQYTQQRLSDLYQRESFLLEAGTVSECLEEDPCDVFEVTRKWNTVLSMGSEPYKRTGGVTDLFNDDFVRNSIDLRYFDGKICRLDTLAEKRAVFKTASFFASLSPIETFCRPALEALIYGVPSIILADCPSMRVLYSGFKGVSFYNLAKGEYSYLADYPNEGQRDLILAAFPASREFADFDKVFFK